MWTDVIFARKSKQTKHTISPRCRYSSALEHNVIVIQYGLTSHAAPSFIIMIPFAVVLLLHPPNEDAVCLFCLAFLRSSRFQIEIKRQTHYFPLSHNHVSWCYIITDDIDQKMHENLVIPAAHSAFECKQRASSSVRMLIGTVKTSVLLAQYFRFVCFCQCTAVFFAESNDFWVDYSFRYNYYVYYSSGVVANDVTIYLPAYPSVYLFFLTIPSTLFVSPLCSSLHLHTSFTKLLAYRVN